MSAAASHPFPLVEGKARGYDTASVDIFLRQVKNTYEGTVETNETAVRSNVIRQQSFSLSKRGYDPRFVDAALDRLEEVLFERERRAFIQEQGTEAWQALVDDLQQDLASRLLRQPGRRFRKRSVFAHGYRKSQVDALLDQLGRRIADGSHFTTTEIRSVKFHVQLGGYCEAQVDAFLDSIIEFILATR